MSTENKRAPRGRSFPSTFICVFFYAPGYNPCLYDAILQPMVKSMISIRRNIEGKENKYMYETDAALDMSLREQLSSF